jgi:hypothetical protein
MLPCGIFKEYKKNQIYYHFFCRNHLFFKVFDTYMWEFMIFEIFKMKKVGE